MVVVLSDEGVELRFEVSEVVTVDVTAYTVLDISPGEVGWQGAVLVLSRLLGNVFNRSDVEVKGFEVI